MIFTIPALVAVGSACYWLIFYAPKLKTQKSNFILIKVKKEKEPEEEMTLLEKTLVYTFAIAIIYLAETYWIFGCIVLGLMTAIGIWRWFKDPEYER